MNRTKFLSKYAKGVVMTLLALAFSVSLGAQQKVLDGYEFDPARPGLRRPVEIDLRKLSSNDGNVPAASNVAGVSRAEAGTGPLHVTTFTLKEVSITMTDATTAGCHGAIQLYDFPAGVVHFLGASYDLTTLAGAGGITDTAALVGAVGTVTVGTGDATLSTTEADYIASTTGTLSSGAGTLKLGTATAGSVIFDGSATAKDAFLNIAVPDAGSTANDTLTVSGTITLVWLNLGDF